MKHLRTWRSKLHTLARRRAVLRWCEAVALVAAMALACSLLVFAADFLFRSNLVQRTILLAAALTATGACWWKWSAPLVAIHETAHSLALSVEEQHGLRNDLVAALQFEEQFSPAWGSVVLQQALVRRTAALGQRAVLPLAFDLRTVLAPCAAALGGLIVWCGLLIAAPHHCQVFLQRMLFFPVNYPTRTVLLEVVVISGDVITTGGGATGRVVSTLVSGGVVQQETSRCLEGAPVTIWVRCAGEIPSSLTLSVFEQKTGQRRVMEVAAASSFTSQKPSSDGAPFAAPPGERWSKTAAFQATLEQVLEPLQWDIVAGDAHAGPFLLGISPPPLIEIEWRAEPPAYAADAAAAVVRQAARRLEVLPGSSVAVSVVCKNAKPLRKVLLYLKTEAASVQVEMLPQNAARTVWKTAQHPLLKTVRQETHLTWRIVDDDGLAPPSPVTAVVAFIADRAPSVLAASSSMLVHPLARPGVVYELQDDFGVASAVVRIAIDRAGEIRRMEFPLQAKDTTPTFPLTAASLPYRGRWSLDLKPLDVQVGDEIQLRVVAQDNRGNANGQPGESPPVVWRVATREEVLRSILQADASTEKTLLELIDLQRTRLKREPAP